MLKSVTKINRESANRRSGEGCKYRTGLVGLFRRIDCTLEKYSVSICTFAMNETESLRICVDTVLQTCRTEDIREILICSCDRTTPECRETIVKLQKQYSQVLIREIWQPPETKRWGGACRALFDAAAGTHILSMSSDLECDPKYVSKLIELSKQNPDKMIKASRWLEDVEFSGYGALRKTGNLLFQKYLSLLFGKKLTDYTFSFQIAPADVFRDTVFHKNGRTVAVELICGPIMRGVEILEIPTPWKKRTEHPETAGFRLKKDTVCLFWYFIVTLDIRFRLKK